MVGSEPTPSGAPLSGLVLGKYKLVRLLGEGGMGAVYEAIHQDLGRRAAVKTLHARYAASESVRQRFLREGQSAARIRHPNVADVYDVGIDGNHPYLVMEYLEGEDMGHLLAREGPFSPQRIADLLLPVVAAVAAAHDLGIVHRDLKPDNIFVSSERGVVKPKVLDFGISKLADHEDTKSLTGTGALLGTPYYMSPEQARASKRVDFRSDQYSLGVIMYQSATNRRPIEEPSLYSLIQRIVGGDFAPPRELNPDLPVAFEKLILKAMARNPADRYPTTRALGAALLVFASEQTKAQYAEEFKRPSGGTGQAAQTVADEALWLDTTLGESAIQPAVPRHPNTTLRWLASGLSAVVILGLGAWRLLSPAAEAPAPVSSSPNSAQSARPEVRPTVTGARTAEPALKPLIKRLSSRPAGATVWSDGRALGEAPLTLDLPTGAPREVELRLPGYVTRKQLITATDPDEVALELVKVPRANASASLGERRSGNVSGRPRAVPGQDDPPSLAPR